ncbi:hypothetical protein NEUTE1DRAFT_77690 [Neurospora tetrasperma FGSC 2508]|uniref:TauD/TfdA-like domain-containing protein n=1 Tax=Neurospora tetrasperma (strain FGSC 2508 / ATCC MYA-4615 / P0657) TaxID=510951 RepID=F8MEB2_NEUT8|nr:uncharacterized protein NEUTE1DRAFT_77690 [Neurospora tetrasperma FGSC 2508]EGO61594.1 hypothetical protein NEUTE1DRAFT_77690 [Neurospora tetrasperma FGSC 2508]EGZ74363.1 Clavaminate synthase-like protein [Neurospora tetrasperma FGSC 2509]
MEKLGTIKAREKPLQRESGAPPPNNLNLGLVGSMAGNVILPAKSPVIHVDEKGIEEVRQALQACADLGLAGDAINKASFPLPTFHVVLDEARRQVHEGQGFVIIRGIGLSDSAQNNNNMFLGLASYIGDVRGAQDKQGSMLSHVTASKSWTVPSELRHGIHTNTGLAWHNDMGTDVIALHVRSLAEEGGNTFVASSWTIYKELATSYPQALELLCEPCWPIQVSGNPPRHIVAPLVQIFNNRVYLSADPGRLGLHPVTAKAGLSSSIPSLTTSHLQALEILSELATRHRLMLDTRPGDILFINNWALIHARDSYKDPKDGPGRHLVRLWLRDSESGWKVPESMRVPWEAAFGPNGDGYPTGVTRREYPLAPSHEYKPPKYTAGSAAFVLDDEDDVNGGNNEP